MVALLSAALALAFAPVASAAPAITAHGRTNSIDWDVPSLATARIHASTDTSGTWAVIDVLSAKGLVRRLYSGPGAKPGQAVWTPPWNGRDARGVYLDTGTYVYRVRISKAGSTTTARGTIRVSSTIPRTWSRDTTDTTPSHYYVWCRDQHATWKGARDRNGIIMEKREGRLVYHPVDMGEWCLFWYEGWLHDHDKAQLAEFLKHARWLRDHMDGQGRLAYDWEYGGLHPPWYSAMSQGLGMSVFARAYTQTHDKSYLDAARRALRPFSKDISKGGVVSGGGRWLEEYPIGNHVLNGSMFAMFGLWDLMRVSHDDAGAAAVFKRSSSNLASNLWRYESNGAILYCLPGHTYCGPTYYRLQNQQLRVMAVLTRDLRFSKTAARWERYFLPRPKSR